MNKLKLFISSKTEILIWVQQNPCLNNSLHIELKRNYIFLFTHGECAPTKALVLSHFEDISITIVIK